MAESKLFALNVIQHRRRREFDPINRLTEGNHYNLNCSAAPKSTVRRRNCEAATDNSKTVMMKLRKSSEQHKLAVSTSCSKSVSATPSLPGTKRNQQKMTRRRRRRTMKMNCATFISVASLIFLALLAVNSDKQQFVEAQTSSLFQNSLYLPSSSSAQLLKRDFGGSNRFAAYESSLQSSASEMNSAKIASPRQTSSNSVCQVNGGESVAILEIEESRGSDMSQSTNPAELPISGSVKSGDIELKIESETHKFFQIQDKRLKLLRPLDRDPILRENFTQTSNSLQPISSIYLQISCLDKRQTQANQSRQRKVIIPVLVKVLDLNDNPPKFSSPNYIVQVDELTPVDTIIFDQIQAIDLDSANNGLIGYSLVETTAPNGLPANAEPAQGRLVQRAQPNEVSSPQIEPSSTGIRVSENQADQMTENSSQSAPTSSIDDSSPSTGKEFSSTTISPSTIPTNNRSGPTINLNSEPIMNGPMEESEAEEESDESLLASMNSTDSSGESDTMESDAIRSSKPTGIVRNKRANKLIKRHLLLATTTLSPANEQTMTFRTTGARQKDLWTNLMVSPSATAATISDEIPVNNGQSAQTSTVATPVSYQLSAGDSNEYFALELAPNSNKPLIRLKKALDYETKRSHLLTVIATDKASNANERLSSAATILIKVLDGDDQGPAFVLDQGGCATGAVPATTVSSLSSIQHDEDSLAGRRRPTRQVQVMEAGASAGGADQQQRQNISSGSQNLPSGFKETEENFEFGDSLSSSEEHDEDVTLENSQARLRRFPQPRQPQVASSRSPVANAAANFRLQEANLGAPESKLTSSSGHYLDYSCLTPTLSSYSGQAEYFATVMSGDTDYLLRIAPQAIKARDRDELNAPIRYSFLNGTPADFGNYFRINPLDASIKQVAPIELSGQSYGRFEILVQAQEQTANKLYSLAQLTIDTIPTDKNPPILIPNSYSGFVDENSPMSSRVYITSDRSDLVRRNLSSLMRVGIQLDPIRTIGFAAQHQQQQQQQLYEFETTSDAFKVNKDGFLYVNKWPLDRDLPGQAVHMFQITARQLGLAHSSRTVSSPVSVNVTLLDLNDNPPILSNSSLSPIQLTASSQRSAGSRQQIALIKATDLDEAENSQMLFSIRHVSNNGRERFWINEQTGQLEALGKFNAGEQFSLTLQVTDELQRYSQGILEVQVIPGANSGGPKFIIDDEGGIGDGQSASSSSGSFTDNLRGYSIEINESLAPNSLILQVRARDPENDPINYAIVDGNSNGDFYINSKTGQIYTAHKLDREEVSAYNLLVQARDSGGLATNRPISIQITDTNDQNPVFSQQQYSFTLAEGLAGLGVFGYVSASDSDAGENGQVSYLLESAPCADDTGRQLFQVSEKTGELRLLEPLDYERARSYTLVVAAKDHGEQPRSTTVSVLIKVLDIQDESPYFERPYLEARLGENLAHRRIAQVQARDPDSVAQITYVLKSGDSNLFSVDPQTGVVSTSERGLDYEEARMHTLLIGTLENQQVAVESIDLQVFAAQLANGTGVGSLERTPICRLEVHVNDFNDNAPQFVAGEPLPVRIQDSAQLGTVVAQVNAEDRDGSEPNNQVRYELVSSGGSDKNDEREFNVLEKQFTSERCAKSFMVDATSGSVSVRADLRRDSQSECRILIRARDLGYQPTSLSSVVSLTIFIDHLAEISPSSMIGFADTKFTVELDENSPPNSLVKVLPVVNKPKVNFPISCELVSGNELGAFYVIENEQRDCELRTTRRDRLIDYEAKQRYSLTLRLSTIGSGSGIKTLAQVQVNVIDKNDNRPVFHQPARYSHLTQGRFLAAIASDAPSETQVIQLRASDADSPHANGLISYEILNSETELEGRFKVDPIDGIVRTSRPVEDLPSTRLPIFIKVMARDNPEVAGTSLDSIAELVVNLIDDRHRLALVLKDTPAGRALDSKEELLGAIQERSGLISGLEKAESMKYLRNGTFEPDVSGTDFWFYLIEPGTFRLVPNDDPRVKLSLLEQRSHNSLSDVISQTLGFQAARIRLPYSMSIAATAAAGAGRQSANSMTSTIRALTGADNFAATLILIAIMIAIISAIVLLCQCRFWPSNQTHAHIKDKLYLQQQHQMPPLYHHQPPGSFLFQKRAHDNYAFNSSTLSGHQQQSLMPQLINGTLRSSHMEPIYGLDAATNAALGKEYETQMLKMSVLFDDSHSVDDQNLHENANIGKNPNY